MKFKRNHLSKEEIALYVEALKFNTTKQLDYYLINHVEACSECQLKVSEIFELIKSDKKITFKDHLYSDTRINFHKKKVVNLKLFIAAASLIIFILLFSMLYRTLFTTKTENISERVSKDRLKEGFTQDKETETSKKNTYNNKKNYTSKSEIKVNNYKENYKEFPALEGMMNTGLRDAIEFRVIAPQSGKVFSKRQAVSFQWKIKDYDPLNIIIYNNKGEMIHAAENIINHYVLHDTLGTGLYYWKLLSKEKDIIYVGKFLIN